LKDWRIRGLHGKAVQRRNLCGSTAGAASPIVKLTNNKRTMKKELLFVGLDVHAKNITIALAEGGGGEARLYGTIPNDLHALEKVFAKLKKAHPGAELRVCYSRAERDRLRAEPQPEGRQRRLPSTRGRRVSSSHGGSRN
jgi:hypothetical protein